MIQWLLCTSSAYQNTGLSMPAATIDLAINQGETFRKGLIWKTGTPLNPVNLTTYTARMQVRSNAASTVVLLTLTTENGGITLGTTDGTIALYLTDLETSAITWEYGVFDIELIAGGSGDVTRLVQGTITVSKEVTR